MRSFVLFAALALSGRYHLQSNPWVNLHQRLMYEAVFGGVAPPAALSRGELAQWQVDDRGNQFCIRMASSLLDAAGEDLVAAHTKAYGAFPKHVFIDVTSYAWEFGAYTVGEADSAQT